MKNSLNNKKIFVAGHNGMVGSSIVKYFYKKGIKKIITKSRKSLDLTNKMYNSYKLTFLAPRETLYHPTVKIIMVTKAAHLSCH